MTLSIRYSRSRVFKNEGSRLGSSCTFIKLSLVIPSLSQRTGLQKRVSGGIHQIVKGVDQHAAQVGYFLLDEFDLVLGLDNQAARL